MPTVRVVAGFRLSLALALAALISLLALADPVGATFPGRNGKIAFVAAADFGLWVANHNGTHQRRLAGHVHDRTAFSPSGRLIAFTATMGRERQIFVIKPDGSGRRRLTHRSSGAANPSFSSDGRELVFDSHGALFMMNADGSDQERLARDAVLPSFSPDGLTIAFKRPDRRGIWTMNADGTDRKRITADGSDFSFSPDGRKIVFADDAGDILVMNADGSHRRRLTNHKKQDPAFAPCFSPDGRKIVFATAVGVILVMNAKTGSIKDKPLITASGIPTSEDWGRRPRRREPEGP